MMAERRRDIDTMRALVVLGLIFFHTARIFDHMDFYVQNDPPSVLITIIVIFVSMWGMPLLFLISGMGVWYSLRSRQPAAFISERFLRLFVPLVFGILVIVPPQQYYSVLFKHPDLHMNYGELLTEFFKVRIVFDFPYFFADVPPLALFQMAHLWFLNLLFFFTLLLLPLFIYLRTSGGERFLRRVQMFFSSSWTIFLLGFPLGVIEAGLRTEMAGGWNRYGYLLFILYGFLLASDSRITQAMRNHWKSAAVIGLISFVLISAAFNVLSEKIGADPNTAYDWGSVLLRFFKGFSGWFWIVGIMGFAGRRRKERPQKKPHRNLPEEKAPFESRDYTAIPKIWDRIVSYFAEAVLPFYVLHQTVIVVIGYYVLQWKMPMFLEYLTISLASLAATLILYDIAVKRLKITRFLFGMKTKRKKD